MKRYFIILCFLVGFAHAETITLEDGTKISSPEIQPGQKEFSTLIGDKSYTFEGKHTTEPLLPKPFYYYEGDPKVEKLEYKELIKNVGSAVVTVQHDQGLGSGVIIHPDGYVVTNQHVIAGSYKSNLKIKFHTEVNGIIQYEEFKLVRVIALSKRYDLALLKIEGFEKRHFPYATITSSNDVEKGDEVVAMGSPQGLERTATKGFVSLDKRSYEQFKDQAFQVVYIQHTAEINPGNSGGPLFNMKGQVIGINSLGVRGGDGLGFAISADFLKYFLSQTKVYQLSGKNMTSGYRYLSPPG